MELELEFVSRNRNTVSSIPPMKECLGCSEEAGAANQQAITKRKHENTTKQGNKKNKARQKRKEDKEEKQKGAEV